MDFKLLASRVGGVSAGVVAGGLAYKYMPESLDPKTKAIALIALGAAIPLAMDKSEILENIGDGIMGKGVAELALILAPQQAEEVGIEGVNKQVNYIAPHVAQLPQYTEVEQIDIPFPMQETINGLPEVESQSHTF